MLRILAILIAFAATCAAQNTYSIIDERTLSGAAGAVTIQQRSTAGRLLQFKWVTVACTVSCNVYLEKNGTAATGTAITPTPVNDSDAGTTPRFEAFHTSNVGAGTKLTPTYTVQANIPFTFDLDGVELQSPGTTKNLTLRIESMTGSYKVHFQVRATR